MAPERGKRVALLTAAVALVVLVAAGVAAIPWLREQSYLSKLESEDEDACMQAANWLVENGSAESKARAEEVIRNRTPIFLDGGLSEGPRYHEFSSGIDGDSRPPPAR